jgi:adenylosuccinate lyase
MIGPDATITLDFALHRLAGLIEKLVVYPDAMLKNINRFGGLVHSQRVMLALTQKGLAREDSYALVQRHAMASWQTGDDFQAALRGDPEVTRHLTEAEVDACFDLSWHARRVDLIFSRVFGPA